jgi:hypothetical protein
VACVDAVRRADAVMRTALAFLRGDGELDAPEASGTGQAGCAVDAIITGRVPEMVTRAGRAASLARARFRRV